MRVMAILASPRKSGNIANMLSTTCKAAKTAGHDVEVFDLYNMNIKPCIGCMKCRALAKCVIQDDAEKLRTALLNCDVVVLASPTYFANVPAPVKNIFDRLSGAVMSENELGIPKGRLNKKQKYMLITACTTPSPFDKIFGQSSGSLRAMREFFKTSGMSCMQELVFAGTKNKTVIPKKIINKLGRCWH